MPTYGKMLKQAMYPIATPICHKFEPLLAIRMHVVAKTSSEIVSASNAAAWLDAAADAPPLNPTAAAAALPAPPAASPALGTPPPKSKPRGPAPARTPRISAPCLRLRPCFAASDRRSRRSGRRPVNIKASAPMLASSMARLSNMVRFMV